LIPIAVRHHRNASGEIGLLAAAHSVTHASPRASLECRRCWATQTSKVSLCCHCLDFDGRDRCQQDYGVTSTILRRIIARTLLDVVIKLLFLRRPSMTAILHPRSITIGCARCLLFGMLSLLAKSSYHPVKTTHQLHYERGAQARSQHIPPPISRIVYTHSRRSASCSIDSASEDTPLAHIQRPCSRQIGLRQLMSNPRYTFGPRALSRITESGFPYVVRRLRVIRHA
jgi:hypothetical protein